LPLAAVRIPVRRGKHEIGTGKRDRVPRAALIIGHARDILYTCVGHS
jgi:hypothetical protein